MPDIDNPGDASAPARRRTVADVLHNEVSAWVVLAISLVITVLSWHISARSVESRLRDAFEFEVEKARLAIVKRMQEYEQVLRSGVGLFLASDEVTRDDWLRREPADRHLLARHSGHRFQPDGRSARTGRARAVGAGRGVH
jgi:hypothetical protein